MKQAIIKIGSRQFNIQEGAILTVNSLLTPLEIGVLYYSDGKTSMVGTTLLEDIVVKATVQEQKRSRKLKVGRFKSKSRYHKVSGQRDVLTVLKIDKISLKGEKEVEPTEKAETKAKPEVKKAEKKSAKVTKKAATSSKNLKKKEK